MIDPTLNGFLLAAAQEDWHLWYGCGTRLMFADWCEENCRNDVAELLRTIKVENSHEWEMSGRVISNVQLRPLHRREFEDEGPIRVSLEHYRDGKWVAIHIWTINPYLDEHRDGLALAGERCRVRAESQHYFTLDYHVQAREGLWYGQLSSEHARLQCCRRVLALFPDAEVQFSAPCECREVGSFGVGCLFCESTGTRTVRIPAPQLIPPESEPSPRWVPYDAPREHETMLFTIREGPAPTRIL